MKRGRNPRVFSQNQDRNVTMASNLLGHAAHHPSLEPGVTMTTHDNQIGLLGIGHLENLLGWHPFSYHDFCCYAPQYLTCRYLFQIAFDASTLCIQLLLYPGRTLHDLPGSAARDGKNLY